MRGRVNEKLYHIIRRAGGGCVVHIHWAHRWARERLISNTAWTIVLAFTSFKCLQLCQPQRAHLDVLRRVIITTMRDLQSDHTPVHPSPSHFPPNISRRLMGKVRQPIRINHDFPPMHRQHANTKHPVQPIMRPRSGFELQPREPLRIVLRHARRPLPARAPRLRLRREDALAADVDEMPIGRSQRVARVEARELSGRGGD